MVKRNPALLRVLGAGVASAMLLAACGGGGSPAPGTSGAPPSGGQAGGTITMLTHNEQFDQVDPQRAYTGEDLAFFGATIQRSLTAYTYSPDAETANGTLVGDLASDTGTPNEDATDWTFQLRGNGLWQDGTPVTCEDIRYGVSRTWATDVISGGPTYASQYLDVPDDYPGPYTANDKQQADFDKAIDCSESSITFHLKLSVPDFNYTVTLGFSPVKEDADKGESYGTQANYLSNGPYIISEYETGQGGRMVLDRNDQWSTEMDGGYRKAYPDQWIVLFGLDEKVIDQRMLAGTGDDATAVQREGIEPENLPTVFTDPDTVSPQFEGRAFSEFDPYSSYLWIRTDKVPNEKIRQAMAVALDREALQLNAGGVFAGELGDGVIKPNIGQDYAETGWATDLFGEAIPPAGNPELAQKLIQESGVPAPTLTYDYAQSPTGDQSAAIIKSSLEKAGFTIKPNAIEAGQYYTIVFDDEKAHEFGASGWGPDWPNASTIIPPLFTDAGGFNLSRVHDEDFVKQTQDALGILDRAEQATAWQELNKEAMKRAYVIPTVFGLDQRLAGTKIQPAYSWPPYGSWPYGEMYVTP